MRQAVTQAAWHVASVSRLRHDLLIDKPLMQNVLADLELETEVGTTHGARPGRARIERAPVDRSARRPSLRWPAAVAKYWLSKRSTPVVREALECVGGNGYVEESNLPRLYREAPLNSIWEGSGNVIALDVLRAATRAPEAVDAFLEELALAGGMDPIFDRELDRLKQRMVAPIDEVDARRVVEGLATCWGASLCLRHEPDVADAYVRSRLDGARGFEFGTLGSGIDVASLARRAVPSVDR